MYDRILLASNGSEESDKATMEAAFMFKALSSEITVVSVIDDSEYRRLDIVPDEIEKKQRDKIKSTESILKQFGVDYDVKILSGNVAKTIVSEAQTRKYDLIIIGCRGLNMIEKAIMGSVSSAVISASTVPVLVAK